MSNSANLGLVPQGNYFDREIANTENTDGYYVICNGDFVYNPRKSTTAPFGPVNIYEGDDVGIISPLYLCFSVHNIFPKFLYYRFKGSAWHSYVYSHGDSGVRFDRVSIKDDVFFDMPIYKPTQDEQIKIATLLQLIDERISIQSRIIEKYETLIKGIVEKILVATQTISLQHYSPIITSGKDKNNEGNYPLYGSTGIIGTVSNPSYNRTVVLVARVGSVGNVQYVAEPCGISDNTLIIDAGEDNRFMYYYLKNYNFIHITSGTTQPLITASSLKKIRVPMIDKQERNKIVTILNAIEYKLNNEKMIASLLYRQKNFLLSQMFI